MRRLVRRILLAQAFAVLLLTNDSLLAQPQYEIISLGQPGEVFSGGQGISSSGQFGAGFTDANPLLIASWAPAIVGVLVRAPPSIPA